MSALPAADNDRDILHHELSPCWTDRLVWWGLFFLRVLCEDSRHWQLQPFWLSYNGFRQNQISPVLHNLQKIKLLHKPEQHKVYLITDFMNANQQNVRWFCSYSIEQ